MPVPNKGESEKDFVSRCIPIVLKDGTAKDNKQASAICHSMYKEKKSADKVGARNNVSDRERIRNLRKIAQQFVELTMELEPTDEDLQEAVQNAAEQLEKSTMNINMKSIKDMGGMAYAHQEGWDISGAAQAIVHVCELVHSEISYEEKEHVKELAEIIKQLCDYILAEADEMVEASTQIISNTPSYYMSATVPAEVKSSPLKLDYVKSLGLDYVPELAVKFVAKDEIKGYSNLWGNPDKVDLEREYFTKDTNFWDNKPQWLTWDHAQDEQFKSDPRIGNIVEVGDDEWGKWYIAKLKKSEAYRKYLDNLIANKAVGSSSDSAPQYVKRVKTGKSIWLKEWPLFAVSLTDNPCEPRMIGSIDFLKSLGIDIKDTEKFDGDMAILEYFKTKYHLGE